MSPRAQFRPATLALYLVTDRAVAGARPLEHLVAAAVAGGVTVVQVREKSLGGRAFVEECRALKRLLAPHRVPLIVNDRIDVALAAEAEGVHLGQSDIAPEEARRLLGPDRVLGLTVEHWEEVPAVDPQVVDYVGASVFPTGTKQDVAGVFGLAGMRRLVRSLPVPVVAIGGIQAANARSVWETGVAGIAVVSALLAAPDPAAEARALRGLEPGRGD